MSSALCLPVDIDSLSAKRATFRSNTGRLVRSNPASRSISPSDKLRRSISVSLAQRDYRTDYR